MPENWKKYNLGDLSEDISYGYTESASKEEIGPKFLRITDIQNDFIDWNEVPYCKISEKDLIKYQVEIGDIVVARTGNSTGATALIKNEINAVYASYLIRYRFNQKVAFPGYLDFVLRSNSWKNYVDAIKGGSAQPGANAKQFAAFEISLPPLPEQKSIASILSALDDKIELNLQMNKTLEEMAMALYKHWFVDFGPFQEGEFVNSELGEIPKGWEVKVINNFGKVVCGKTPSKKNSDNFTHIGGYPFIKIPEMHGNVFITETSERVSEKGNQSQIKKLLPSGCINVSCIATVGLVTINSVPSHTNQQINSIIPEKKEYRYYLYSTMISLKERFLNEASGGSATLNMNTSTFSNIEILKPDEKSLQKYSEVVTPIFQKILQNHEENQTLTQLRDTLLPKLISGEVRVKEAEKIFNEVL